MLAFWLLCIPLFATLAAVLEVTVGADADGKRGARPGARRKAKHKSASGS